RRMAMLLLPLPMQITSIPAQSEPRLYDHLFIVELKTQLSKSTPDYVLAIGFTEEPWNISNLQLTSVARFPADRQADTNEYKQIKDKFGQTIG
ncbi:hypothetical protein J6590_016791, partial [Homalodisca vitripennis]